MRLGSRSLFLKAVIVTATLTPGWALCATHNVSDSTQLRNALSSANSGDTIIIAAGTYQPSSSLNVQSLSQSNGGAARTLSPQFMLINKSNITIRGASASNRPKLQGTGITDGKYAFYAQKANGLVLKDIEFRNAMKGVIIDRSDDVTIDNIRIENIGNEGLHFRDGSDNGETKNSEFYKIGMDRKDRGEALYICNDKKKWHPNYDSPGTDDIYQENCDNHHIHHNEFLGEIGAEHIDIKEGTRGHNIHNNTFIAKVTNSTLINATGDFSKSIIHDKGYNNRIHNNTFNMANMKWYGTGEWAAIRVEQVLDDGEYGANIYGHNGGYVYNTLTNSNGGSSDEFVVVGPSDGANSAKVGCDTINGGHPKYRRLSSKSGLNIDGGIGDTGSSVVTGGTCNNYTNGAGGGGNPIVFIKSANGNKHAEDTGIHAGSTQPNSGSTVQKWKTQSLVSGTVHIINEASNRSLHDRAVAQDALVWHTTAAQDDQQWVFESLGSGQYRIRNVGSGRYLKDNGIRNAITRPYENNGSFKWQWVGSGTYRQLKNVGTGMYLEDTMKHDVKTGPSNQNDNAEKWEKIDKGSFFMFKNVSTGLCMHNRFIASDVIANTCNAASGDQQWTIHNLSGGKVHIRNVRNAVSLKHDNGALDVMTAPNNSGATDQQWYLVTP